MHTLRSRAISHADYDEATAVLTLWFAETGKAWDYFAVPRSVFDGLLGAESPGQYFAEHIRDRYPAKRHRRLKTDDWPE